MSKGIKIGLIILAVIALIGLAIFGLCGLGIVKGGGLLLEEYNKIQEEFLTEACEDLQGTDYTEADYQQHFSSSFKSEYSYEESKELLNRVMPNEGCDGFKVEGFWDMISKGISVGYTSDAVGGTTLSVSYPNDGTQVTIYMIKDGEDWKINQITEEYST